MSLKLKNNIGLGESFACCRCQFQQRCMTDGCDDTSESLEKLRAFTTNLEKTKKNTRSNKLIWNCFMSETVYTDSRRRSAELSGKNRIRAEMETWKLFSINKATDNVNCNIIRKSLDVCSWEHRNPVIRWTFSSVTCTEKSLGWLEMTIKFLC